MPKKPNKSASEEKLALDLLGQLSLQLDAEYTLRPSRQALSNIQKATGKSLYQLAVQCGAFALTTDELGIATAEMMKATAVFDPTAGASYKGAKADRLADLIYEAGMITVSRRLAVILVGALDGGYTASGEVKAAGKKTTEPTLTA